MKLIKRRGWNHEIEPQSYERLCASEHAAVLSAEETRDIIADRIKAVSESFSFDRDVFAKTNYVNDAANYQLLPVRYQQCNDCTAHGVAAAVQGWQTINTYLGFKEQTAFLVHRPFCYSWAYGSLTKESGDVGRSISCMLLGVSEVGVLPEDQIEIGHEYSAKVVKAWCVKYRDMDSAPFARYIPLAKQYKVTVGNIGRDADLFVDACRAGLAVVYGAVYYPSRLNGNTWTASTGGGHCQAAYGWKQDGTIGIENSWNDGFGWATKDIVKRMTAGRYFDAFAIIDMEPRPASKPNWELIPGWAEF
ncbi:MAG: hypothetical protein LBQ54_02200 [Planctomycetaceae bacterium]|jgi:hypothetical protein|nr:hypothetical protein [Planctomycetaceae bacterium]